MCTRLFLILAGLSVLAGCGGGGSSPSPAPVYSGVTAQAVVTESNAKALSADAYSGSQLSSAVSGIAKEVAVGNGQPALLQSSAAILERSITRIVAVSKSSAKVVAATAQDTIYGDGGGSFTFSINYDQISGAFNGTISFSQFKETATSPTISGPISFSGVYSQVAGTFTSLNISLSNLTGGYGGKSFKLYGSVSYSLSGATKNVIMSVLLTDNVSGNAYWVKDFTLAFDGSLLTVTGTYYDPVQGYVVISTATPLTVTAIDAMPTSGQLIFTGRNGTKARLTFAAGSYTVEADLGNGVYVVVP